MYIYVRTMVLTGRISRVTGFRPTALYIIPLHKRLVCDEIESSLEMKLLLGRPSLPSSPRCILNNNNILL